MKSIGKLKIIELRIKLATNRKGVGMSSGCNSIDTVVISLSLLCYGLLAIDHSLLYSSSDCICADTVILQNCTLYLALSNVTHLCICT